MKKIYLFLFVCALPFTGWSQANKEDVRKLLLMNGAATKYDAYLSRFSESLPESKRESFKKDSQVFINKYLEQEVKFYSNEFSQDEVLKLIEFYKSPLGIKYVQKAKEIENLNIENAQQNQLELQGIIMKYMM